MQKENSCLLDALKLPRADLGSVTHEKPLSQPFSIQTAVFWCKTCTLSDVVRKCGEALLAKRIFLSTLAANGTCCPSIKAHCFWKSIPRTCTVRRTRDFAFFSLYNPSSLISDNISNARQRSAYVSKMIETQKNGTERTEVRHIPSEAQWISHYFDEDNEKRAIGNREVCNLMIWTWEESVGRC